MEPGSTLYAAPVAVAQPVAPPVAVAQPVHVPVQQAPVAVGQPIPAVVVAPQYMMAQPGVPPYPQAAQPPPYPQAAQPPPYPQAAQPPPVQAMQRTTYTVNAFGFVLKDREYELQAERLSGCYVSGTWDCFPIPGMQCLHFKAVNQDTLLLDATCCCGVPSFAKGPQVTFERDYPNGFPNQFTAPGTTFEFGKFNGLCAGASGHSYNTCCFLHVVRC